MEKNGENEALTGNYDLILLDIMLPKKNGFEVLSELRKEKIQTPVIMLTAKFEIQDKLKGLENGADDYITKPFHTGEVLARIKAVLRRANQYEELSILQFGDIKLDIRNAKVYSNNGEIQINGKELELLEQLLLNKNQISTRESLTQKIWGYESDAEYNNVEVYITFLRRKLNLLKSDVKIKAVRGIGYKLEEENNDR